MCVCVCVCVCVSSCGGWLVLHSREFVCVCVCVCVCVSSCVCVCGVAWRGVAQALPRCSRVSSYGLHPLKGMKVCRALN